MKDTAMHRRTLLSQPIALTSKVFVQNTPRLVQQANENVLQSGTVYMYGSYDRRFVSYTMYEDSEECVSVTTKYEWYDPITKEPMSKTKKELFILEDKEV